MTVIRKHKYDIRAPLFVPGETVAGVQLFVMALEPGTDCPIRHRRVKLVVVSHHHTAHISRHQTDAD